MRRDVKTNKVSVVRGATRHRKCQLLSNVVVCDMSFDSPILWPPRAHTHTHIPHTTCHTESPECEIRDSGKIHRVVTDDAPLADDTNAEGTETNANANRKKREKTLIAFRQFIYLFICSIFISFCRVGFYCHTCVPTRAPLRGLETG